MGAHIDHSKDINKMGNIVGDMGNLGFDGTTTLLGTGSHGTPGELRWPRGRENGRGRQGGREGGR